MNDEQINYIANEIIKGKNIDFEKYYSIQPSSYGTIIKEYDSIESYNKDFRSITTLIYNRNDLLNNNAINLPREISYENTYANSTKTPKEILVDIQINEEKIKTNLQKLAIINKFDNLIAQEKVFSPWFINETMDDMHVALNYFYSNYYSDILTESNIEELFAFQVKNNITKETFLNLKILFEDKRIQLFKTKVKIYFGKDKEKLQKDINWSKFYDLFNPLEEEEIKSILELIKDDPQIELIFENLCQYWMLDQNEEKTLLKQKKYKVKDFVRCLKVLENLGLVFFNKKNVLSSKEGHSEIDLYKRYIPNIKYLDAIKFKENQDV